jgi:hypothetical protein
MYERGKPQKYISKYFKDVCTRQYVSQVLVRHKKAAFPVIEIDSEIQDGIKFYIARAETSKGSIQTKWHTKKSWAKAEAIAMIKKEQG